MFFSAASEGNDDGVGIAEDAADGGDRAEAWERVKVEESREDGHATIVTSFAEQEKTKTPTK